MTCPHELRIENSIRFSLYGRLGPKFVPLKITTELPSTAVVSDRLPSTDTDEMRGAVKFKVERKVGDCCPPATTKKPSNEPMPTKPMHRALVTDNTEHEVTAGARGIGAKVAS